VEATPCPPGPRHPGHCASGAESAARAADEDHTTRTKTVAIDAHLI
jgi:hypothetical protein